LEDDFGRFRIEIGTGICENSLLGKDDEKAGEGA
jgi:hypothetical protein